jgi:hypothetical protein
MSTLLWLDCLFPWQNRAGWLKSGVLELEVSVETTTTATLPSCASSNSPQGYGYFESNWFSPGTFSMNQDSPDYGDILQNL